MNVDRKSIIMAITDQGGIGPRMFQQLLLLLGPPENFLDASFDDLNHIPRLGENGSERVLNSLKMVDKFQAKLEDYNDNGIDVITILDDDFPEALRNIDDPPPIIYLKGNKSALDIPYMAVVGTTQATQEGIRLTVDVSAAVAGKGFGIVSGLASGIDTAAHLAAIKANIPTIAVLGGGVLNIYPEDNTALAEKITELGLLISEHQPYKEVKASRLILRNRLIAAFAKAVLVTQVGIERRGELRTADYAFKQAKPVFFGDPEKNLDLETINAVDGVMIDGPESIEKVIEYII